LKNPTKSEGSAKLCQQMHPFKVKHMNMQNV